MRRRSDLFFWVSVERREGRKAMRGPSWNGRGMALSIASTLEDAEKSDSPPAGYR